MKKKTLEVFHLFGNSSLSRMSDDLIYKVMDNVTFKQIEKSILLEIENYEKVLNTENSEIFFRAIERDKKLLIELKDHFEWIKK